MSTCAQADAAGTFLRLRRVMYHRRIAVTPMPPDAGTTHC